MYLCPMHPEVREAVPGTCPLCHMALVREGSAAHLAHTTPQEKQPAWRAYLPLAVVFAILLAATTALALRRDGAFSLPEAMLDFMTGFFLVFAGFKLLDLRGFVDGYATYDLLARRVRAYGYAYPFIELSFGLLMLAGVHDAWLLWTEAAVMSFSGVGVALKLAKGEKFQCACLGTFLRVPLTTVTLFEDFGMAALAVFLLIVGA